MKLLFYKIIALAFLFISGSAMGQDTDNPYISINGNVDSPITLTVEQLSKYPYEEYKTVDKTGQPIVYGGTALSLILDQAGAPLSPQLRGAYLADYILINAKDGYRVIYALPEVDPEFSSSQVLVVTTKNGLPLNKKEGPFRIVNSMDGKHARWIRQVKEIKIVTSKY